MTDSAAPSLREAYAEFAAAHERLARLEGARFHMDARRAARDQVDSARRAVADAHARANPSAKSGPGLADTPESAG